VTGVLLGLALLTKAWAIGLVGWAALAYLLALLGPARDRRAAAVLSGALAGGLALLVGGWWWIANVVRFGTLQPQGMDLLPARDVDRDLLAFTTGMLKRLTASTWGNFGWLEVQISEPVRVAAAAVVVLGFAVAVSRRSDVPWARPATAVALGALCLQLAVVYQQSLKNYLRGGYFAGLQGRYLYSFVAIAAALVAIGLCRLLPRGRRGLAPVLALGVAVVLQGIGVLTALHGFWWPSGQGVRAALAIQAAWAPFPRFATVAAVAVACTASVLLLAAVVRPARRPDPQPVPSGPAGSAQQERRR
jgi:hypothetical protein